MTDDAETGQKKRMGRPPKPASEVKRHGVAFRVNDRLREQIHRSAEENQRSVAEEVEYRLQLSATVAPLVDEMASDDATKELFRTLAKTLKSVKIIAKRANLDETDTRAALKRAFDHIGEIYFWPGGEVSDAPEGYVGKMNEAPLKMHQRAPAVIGYSVASDVMLSSSIWDACKLMDDFDDAVIVDRWSGDGTNSIDAKPACPSSAPARSLEDIMTEVNPRDRKERAKKP